MNIPRSENSIKGFPNPYLLFFIGMSYFIIPFSFFPGLFDSALSLRFCLLALLIAAAAIMQGTGFIRAPQPSGDAPPGVVWAGAGYCLACVLSALQSINKSEATAESAKVFLLGGFVWAAAAAMHRSQDTTRLIARGITASALVVSALGALEYWGVMGCVDAGSVGPGATMFNRNLLSSFLFLCLGFVLFIAGSDGRRFWRLLGMLACALIMYMLLATQTRAVWIGCAGGTLCALALLAATQKSWINRFFREKKRIIAVLSMVFGLVFVTHSFCKPIRPDRPSLVQRAATIFDTRFKSNHQRILLWKKTARMFRERPVLGVGPGNWKIVCPKFGTGDLLFPDMDKIETRPYNDFLWVLSETGVTGFVMYCGLFFLAGLSCVKRLRGGTDPKSALLAFLMLFTLSGFAIISFFDFPKERIEHLVLFGTVLSVCASINPAPSKPSGTPPWARRVAAFSLLLCAGACLWIGYLRLCGDIGDAAMRSFWEGKEWKKAIFAANRALSPLYTMEPTSTPILWYRGTAHFKLSDIDRAFSDYKKASGNHPWHLNVLNDLGTCYNLKGDRKSAMRCYWRALAISPQFEPSLINLAALYYNDGAFDSAYCIISKSKGPHRDPRFESYFRTISQKFAKGRSP
jgi:O-antigen ligase